jgi:hypothetical protein
MFALNAVRFKHKKVLFLLKSVKFKTFVAPRGTNDSTFEIKLGQKKSLSALMEAENDDRVQDATYQKSRVLARPMHRSSSSGKCAWQIE